MARSVLLRHELPDGSHHFDWLVEPADTPAGADPQDRSLITWRLSARPTPGLALDAERLAPHRRIYLTYEGPVSGGRGTVRRLAAGPASVLRDAPDRFEAEVTLDGVPLRVLGRPRAGSEWTLAFANAAPEDV